jgi:NADH:ubiquinone oxidoreductase subunit 4 (subunit M)
MGESNFFFFFSDFLRNFFLFLTILIRVIMTKIIKYSKEASLKNFRPTQIIFVLNFILILRFLVSDLIGFYVFFELSMVPTRLLILCWGSQPERIQATLYFFVYTLIGSFPFLGKLIYLSSKFLEVKKILYWFKNSFLSFSLRVSHIVSLFFFFVFLIKLPLYGFHR